MEARVVRAAFLAAIVSSLGAGYRTPNFIVNAPSQDVAAQVGKLAEQYRRELAVEWLGEPLPNWQQPCPITVEVGPHLGAGGATSFVFDRGRVFGWQMTIQGPLDRLLDSVLPHEVTHTIFADHFRQPLPRWADEGACSTVEHRSERIKQQKMLVRFLQTGRGIAFDEMFRMKDYPRDILPLYAQGHSLATFLVAQGGKRKFVEFVGEGLQTRQWKRALNQHYRFTDLGTLQNTWLDWVKQGSPLPLKSNAEESLVSNTPSRLLGGQGQRRRPQPNLIHQVADNDAAHDQLVPVHLPGKATGAMELASSDDSQYPSDVDRSTPGWRRGGQARPAPQSESVAEDVAGLESAVVMNQVSRPQPAEQVKQVILEWNQPPRAARNAAPTSSPAMPIAAELTSTKAPGASSIYEGRTGAPPRR